MKTAIISLFLFLFLPFNSLIAQQQSSTLTELKKVEITFQRGIMDCPVYGYAFVEKMTEKYKGKVTKKDEKNQQLIVEIPLQLPTDDIKKIFQNYLIKEHYPKSHILLIKVLN